LKNVHRNAYPGNNDLRVY